MKSVFCSGSAERLGFWVMLLMLASHTDKSFYHGGQKINLKRGQFITGRKQLAKLCRVSEMKAERLLSVLESEHQIEQQKTNKYRIITILNYDAYQKSEQQFEQQMNNRWSTDEQQMNTINNDKNVKNVKKERESLSSSVEYLKSIPEKDIEEITSGTSATRENVTVKAEELYDYCKAHGKRYKDYRAFLRNAVRRDFPAVQGGMKGFNYKSLKGMRL